MGQNNEDKTSNLCLQIFKLLASKNLPELVAMMIQYLDETDIKEFLLNCHSDILKIKEKLGKNFKTTFIVLLTEPTNILEIEYIKNMVKVHLFYFTLCLLSYNLYSNSKTKKVTDNFLHLTNDEIKKVLQTIIRYYTKYRFYYFYTSEKIIKIHFQLTDNEIKEYENYYKLEHSDRTSYIILPDTQLKYDLHKKLKHVHIDTEFIKKIFKYKSENSINSCLNEYFDKVPQQGVDYFLTLNQSIYEALTFELDEHCAWCNPLKDKDLIIRIVKANNDIEEISAGTCNDKCTNCNNLQKELKFLQDSSNNQKLKKIDFSSVIKSISFDDKYDSLEKLRAARHKNLLKVLNEYRNASTRDTIEQIKKLSKKSFSTIINLK